MTAALLNGLLWHACGQQMRHAGDVYACACGATVPAVGTEQTVLLGALLRAFAALRQVGREPDPEVVRVERELAARGAPIHGRYPVPTSEVRAWLYTNMKDRYAAVRVAYTEVTVTATGDLHTSLRHELAVAS